LDLSAFPFWGKSVAVNGKLVAGFLTDKEF
jgi:hypothetical protein